jgi:AcrR family transcriptional regulator
LTVGYPTRRLGGRTAEVTRRINAAVVQLLVERGIDGCTFAPVAETAKIERSTLYRRYGDRWAMIIDAILNVAGEQIPVTSLGSLREDLRFLLGRTAELLATPLGPAVWAAAAALRAGSAPEHRVRFWLARSAQIEPIIDAAKSRGELPRNIDAEELLSFALGAIHFRMLVIGEPVDPQIIDRIVNQVCRLYCRRASSVEMETPIATPEIQ